MINTDDNLHVLPRGKQLGEYIIDSVLNRGGFGLVYLAHYNHEKFVIKEYMPSDFSVRTTDSKVLPKTQADTKLYQWGLDRFIDEAKVLCQFNHPNIVKVDGFFRANNTAYMVMQYEKGMDLLEWLKQHDHLTESKLLDLFQPIIEGLKVVHKQGYLHRDIKPQNIYIREVDDSPVLIDFGSARFALRDKSKTLTNIISAGFSPPEQYSSDTKQGRYTDIYSLAACLYYAMGRSSLPEATGRMYKILHEKKDPLRSAVQQFKGKYRVPFLQAIDQGLAFSHTDRPQDLDEFWQLLTDQKRKKNESSEETKLPSKDDNPSLSWQLILGSVGLVIVGFVGSYLFMTKNEEQVPNYQANQDSTFPQPSMVKIPAGSFKMGCLSQDNDCGDDEKKHTVQIKAFWMSQHEVTVKQYKA